MTDKVQVGAATLYLGDCREVLTQIDTASVDAIVCDPPYELGFMGRGWDRTGIANDVSVWKECLRVLKPGGHLLAFSGTRTYHRMVCAIEDAGFEVRDRARFKCAPETKYGPLWDSLNNEQRGALLELLNDQLGLGSELAWEYGSGFPKSSNLDGAWQGWGTPLKPAHEPICVARKPLVGTVAANVLEYGTGALNIDACRIPTSDKLGGGAETGTTADQKGNDGWTRPWMSDEAAREAHAARVRDNVARAEALGRWPANVIHDGSDEVLAAFPDAPGQIARAKNDGTSSANQVYGALRNVTAQPEPRVELDKSAARFFYCAKASRADRNDGCEHMPRKPLHWSSGDANPGAFQSEGTDRTSQNNHPTVKPTELMRYLVRLVTPPGGTVLDPFMGSGSTGKACAREGFAFVGIDVTPEYVEIARARIAYELDRINRELEAAARQGSLFELA